MTFANLKNSAHCNVGVLDSLLLEAQFGLGMINNKVVVSNVFLFLALPGEMIQI